MKQRRLERVERRRPLVELNLISADEARASSSRWGCASFLTRGALVLAAFAVHFLGLH
jgi:hypothetical protein